MELTGCNRALYRDAVQQEKSPGLPHRRGQPRQGRGGPRDGLSWVSPTHPMTQPPSGRPVLLRTLRTLRLLLLPTVLLACGRRPGSHLVERDSLRPESGSPDNPLASPPEIRDPSVVAFWLAASDTLKPGEGADLLDDFRSYTGLVTDALEDAGIGLVATTADSVIVLLEGGPRRVIMLSGLDYPFGYVLVEPGQAETILTGVSTDDELLDEVDWYFGLDED